MLTAVVLPKLPGEVRSTVLDFSPALAAGQTFASASTTVSVFSGVDPSPPAFTATVSGTNILVTETAGITGVIYSVLVSAPITSTTLVAQLQYYLAVIPPTL